MPNSGDFEREEYFALLKTISEADQRLLTIKGWGVTLSLAALGFAFQYRAYGLFLVAAVSSASFWMLEFAAKRHQMRHYPRMREIEVNRYILAPDVEKERSSPRIDWSWNAAGQLFRRGEPSTVVVRRGRTPAYLWSWLAAHVALPHALTLVAGLTLFALGHSGQLGGFSLGAAAGR